MSDRATPSTKRLKGIEEFEPPSSDANVGKLLSLSRGLRPLGALMRPHERHLGAWQLSIPELLLLGFSVALGAYLGISFF